MLICLGMSFISTAWAQRRLSPSSILSCRTTPDTGRTTQKDLSFSGFFFLVGKKQLYFHSFRITSHYWWSQHQSCLKGATLLNVTSWVAVHFFSADLLLGHNLCHWHWGSSPKQCLFLPRQDLLFILALTTPGEGQAQAPTDLTMPI